MKKKQAVVIQHRIPDRVLEAQKFLRSKVVGQDQAISQITSTLEKIWCNLHTPKRTLGNFLFMGVTGTGKTSLAEYLADYLHESSDDINHQILKVSCTEYQESHSLSRIFGAPPGYADHNKSNLVFTNKKLKAIQNKDGISVILIDEIEKAHPEFFNMLLSILDRASVVLSNSEEVDFSRSIIIFTSNLGVKELDSRSIPHGFGKGQVEITNREREEAAVKAAKSKFAPEFWNRLDKIIHFYPLSKESTLEVLNNTINKLQESILKNSEITKFILSCDDSAQTFLLEKGSSPRYGVRYLNRTVDQYIISPLSRILLNKDIAFNDLVIMSHKEGDTELTFSKLTEIQHQPREMFIR